MIGLSNRRTGSGAALACLLVAGLVSGGAAAARDEMRHAAESDCPVKGAVATANANLRESGIAAIGKTVTFSGSATIVVVRNCEVASSRPASFSWKLVARPSGSAASLAISSQRATTVLDVSGDYRVRFTACPSGCSVSLGAGLTRTVGAKSAEAIVSVITNQRPVAALSVSVPRRADVSWSFWDTRRDTYRPGYVYSTWRVTVDACRSRGGTDSTGAPAPVVAYRFRFVRLDGPAPVIEQAGSTCRVSLTLPALGRWRVTATVSTVSARATAEQQIRDLVVLAVGDSLTSGQGNPDRNRTESSPAVWKDRQCDRSAASWAARIARSLENSTTSVTFLDFACSGATTNDMVVGDYRGQDPQANDARLPAQTIAAERVLGSLAARTTRSADIVLMSAGINNLDFGDTLDACAHNKLGPCADESPANRIPDLIDALPSHYAWLAAALKFHIRISRVHVLEYPTRLFTDDVDLADGCGAFTLIDDDDAQWLIDRGDEMNAQLKNAAGDYDWAYLGGVRDAFRRHGYCADDTWFRSYSGSNKLQGNKYGTGHPNRDGHAAIVETVSRLVRPGGTPPAPARVKIEVLRVRAGQANIDDVEMLPSPLFTPHFYFTVTGFRSIRLPAEANRALPIGKWVNPGASGIFATTTAANEIRFSGAVTLPGLRIEDPDAPKGFRVTGPRTMTVRRLITRDDVWSVPPRSGPTVPSGPIVGPVQHAVVSANGGGSLEVDYRISVGAPVVNAPPR